MANNEFNNARQIHLYQTGKYLLEAIDNLKVVDEGKEASSIHHKWSKIHLVAQNYADRSKSVKATANIDPDKFLLLANDVLTGQFSGYREQKLLAHKKREDGKVVMTLLQIDYRDKDNQGNVVKMPWTVTIQNGWATPQTTDIGGTSAAKGSVELDKNDQGVEKSVKVHFSYDDFRRYVLVVSNYIRNWEQAVFPHCMKLRAQFEREQQDAQQNAGPRSA